MNDQQLKCLQIANCFEFMPDSDQTQNQSELDQIYLKHPIKDSVTFLEEVLIPFTKLTELV